MKVILHIDIDAFFPSAARLLEPSLIGRPIAISDSTKRSVVSSSSYEARALGVKAGMPLFKALKKSPDIVFVKPNFN
jgi:DNA polymerase-4